MSKKNISIQNLLPLLIDYRLEFDFVFNQFDIGSCTSNAICLLLYFMMKRQKYNAFIPSRLFLYYNTRCLMGDVDHDTGSYEKEAIQALLQYGVCPESMWPYDISKFTEKPSEDCYQFGAQYPFHIHIRSVLDSSMRLEHILKEISKNLLSGCLWLCTIRRWKEQYIEKETGYLYTPGLFPISSVDDDGTKPTPQKFYHSILIVGSDPVKGHLICMNSFGTEGGIDNNGSFYIRYEEIPHVILLENTIAIFGYFKHYEQCPSSILLDSGSALLSKISQTSQTSKKSNGITTDTTLHLPALTTTSYDHVVIGGGMTGAYLVHRLSQHFPDDSILLIDQGFFGGEESSVQSSPREAGGHPAVIESTAYRVNPFVTPKSYDLVEEFQLPFIPYQQGQLYVEDIDYNFFQRVLEKVAETVGLQNPEEMFDDYETFTSLEFKKKLYDDPVLCSKYFSTWMLENGFTAQEYDTLITYFLHGNTIHDNLPFPVFVYHIFCFYSYIRRPDSWIKLSQGILPLKQIFLSQFKTLRLGEFLSSPPQYAFLVDTHALFDPLQIPEMEQSSSISLGKLLHVSNPLIFTVSPNTRVGFKQLYTTIASPTLSRPLSFTHLVRKPHLKISLLFPEALSETILEYAGGRVHRHGLLGRITLNGDNPCVLTLTMDGFMNRNYILDLLFSTTPDVMNNVQYDVESFPNFEKVVVESLQEVFQVYPFPRPEHFLVYLYNSNDCALCTMDVTTGGHSLTEAIDINLGVESRVHILNANYGFFFFFLENAFELVDYYFSKTYSS
jgi:hypothetical protein